ncbi:FLCY [Symbiodinium pilosum]|uniref:FLCY protein n=1 Tax=Symbiodinium pilosum TaxID=2952 RepID=A0A812KIS3_SYMPI|nr:FLCY [Symbiodinium pilosum]
MEQEKHEAMMQKAGADICKDKLKGGNRSESFSVFSSQVKDKLKADREDVERREFAMHALQDNPKWHIQQEALIGHPVRVIHITKHRDLPMFAGPMLRLFLCALLGLVAGVPRVAVVGAGINGASAVHFLRELLGDGVDITVYEASREPGGRTLTRTFANVTIDVGGTAIYSRNRYISGFAKSFGLLPAGGDDGVNSDIGIWDGDEFRIKVDSDSKLDLGAKLLWRYGLSPLHVIPAVRKAVDSFDRIYSLQDQQQSFKTPAELFDALGVFNLTQTSAYDYFASLGVGQKFVREMVDGASRCNYNQPGTLNSFADLISLAGVGVGGHVFGLANGTQAISRGLLASATRVRLGERVVRVTANATGYTVQSTKRSEHFDGVILATPLELTAIQLPAEARQHAGSGRRYQATYVTFVHGQLNETYFRLKATNAKTVPGTVLTTEDSSSPFSSFGVHRKFPDGSMVVKLFSRRQLHDSDIQPLFPRVPHSVKLQREVEVERVAAEALMQPLHGPILSSPQGGLVKTVGKIRPRCATCSSVES